MSPSAVSSNPSSLDTNYWAFFGNPRVYRVDEAVRELVVDRWTTKKSKVKKGDRVIIWRGAGKDRRRGIIALGLVLADPSPLSDADNPYWIHAPAPTSVEDRVPVLYSVPEGLPLWIDCPEAGFLKNLNVARSTGGTVFHVTEDQWDSVINLLEQGRSASPELSDAAQAVDLYAGKLFAWQGRHPSALECRAIELRAMSVAQAYLEHRGWNVTDVSSIQSYDLYCTRPTGEVLHVEVKGTTGAGTEVLLTPNEVRNARKHYPNTALIVVSGIEVRDLPPWQPLARGGSLTFRSPWQIEDRALSPIGYAYTVPPRQVV